MRTSIAVAVASIIGVAAVGCNKKTVVEKTTETKVTTPGGETTTTTTQKVETSGEIPPAAKP